MNGRGGPINGCCRGRNHCRGGLVNESCFKPATITILTSCLPLNSLYWYHILIYDLLEIAPHSFLEWYEILYAIATVYGLLAFDIFLFCAIFTLHSHLLTANISSVLQHMERLRISYQTQRGSRCKYPLSLDGSIYVYLPTFNGSFPLDKVIISLYSNGFFFL